jgi:glyoxalase family protein
MESVIKGLHHVTATVHDAQRDLDFYLDALGLRLVKQTVNFDNRRVYHFYYGDERGTPGTIWTTFPYKGWGVPVGRKGAGQIEVTSFSVPAGSLDFWRKRLAELGVPVREQPPRFGEESIGFPDPSGLLIELVANGRDNRAPWTGGGVGKEAAIRGLHSVTMVVADPARTLELMTGLLGFRRVNEAEARLRLAVSGDEPGKTIEVVSRPDAPAAMNGLGTVHHVAMAVADGEDQLRLRRELVRLGIPVTEVMDRKYFRSIYFREPGGVLFEAATVQPGFTVDEELPCLGQDLQLPVEDEPKRAEIAAGLPELRHPAK